MLTIPINHKTIFLFDHSNYFSSNCAQTFEYDVTSKMKSSNQQQTHNIQKLEPMSKTLWTCCIEAAFEFSRVVYDLFPENKLLRLLVTKIDLPLNSWTEQGQENLMSIMGNIMPPMPQRQQLFEGEEFISLCKALNIAVNSIAQPTELQYGLLSDLNAKKLPSGSAIPNSGRIILFTSAKNRNLDQIQEFLSKSIEECNKNVDQMQKNEKSQQINSIKINLIELVVVDVVPCDSNLIYEKELVKQYSKELRTRILSSKAGQFLPMKMIQLVQNFYELAATTVTNIPMKEEQNANSSANYDVEILHAKSLHDQLKICGILKNCMVSRDGVENLCLKWSNPKTNITEFNFSSCSYRITPTDVNSRPASCLTSFLLSGRCVVLEVPRSSSSRIFSHVLCNHGNEIFMHCLNFFNKSNLDERPSIENIGAKLENYRTNEFVEFIKSNTITNFITEFGKETFCLEKIMEKLEKSTRKWPITYNENLISNFSQLSSFLKSIIEEKITDNQFNENIKCIDYFQYADLKKENLIAPSKIIQKFKDTDLNRIFWNELENFLRYHQDSSEKHKALFNHVKKTKYNLVKAHKIMIPQTENDPSKNESTKNYSEILNPGFEFEEEKLSKKVKFFREFNSHKDEKNILEFWTNVLNEKNKPRFEFYGRIANPNSNIAPLYTNLKLDENTQLKNISSKLEMA